MKIGIAVDDWKLPVFRNFLTAAGYEYQDGGALAPDVTLLTVETSDMLKLKKLVISCRRECAKIKR